MPLGAMLTPGWFALHRYSTFLHLEQPEAIHRNQSATCVGALQFWALLSQDELLAAHELSSLDEKQAGHAARLRREVQPVGEAPVVHEL